LLTLLVEDGIVDVFVAYVFGCVVFPFDVVKVVLEFASAGVFFGEGVVFPEFFVEELVDGRVAVDLGAGVAVPVPDTTSPWFLPRIPCISDLVCGALITD
jgi:hypothetical protein